MGYIRISKENCFCVYEDEQVPCEKLSLFFSFGQVAFVKNRLEKIVGIISFNDYQKSVRNGEDPINRNFKRIIFHKGYMEEVERFFDSTIYQSVPVLNKDETLVESYVRMEIQSTVTGGDQWINITNRHLAELVRKKGYKKIKIAIVNSQSNDMYQYFKHYKCLYETVEKILWYDILEMRETDIVITNYKIDLGSNVPIYSFDSLLIELEYRLLLHNCKKNKVKLYFISVPTNQNLWNITEEERKRISRGGSKKEYFQNRELYSELLDQVLDRTDDRDEFIDSCMDLPPVVIKDQFCYMREHSGKYVNVVNGNRLTEGVPDHWTKHIYLSGNSFVFGPLADDGHTVSSLLQGMLNRTLKSDYKVVNEGVRGAPVYESLKRLNHDHFSRKGGGYHCAVYSFRTFFSRIGRRCEKIHIGQRKDIPFGRCF